MKQLFAGAPQNICYEKFRKRGKSLGKQPPDFMFVFKNIVIHPLKLLKNNPVINFFHQVSYDF